VDLTLADLTDAKVSYGTARLAIDVQTALRDHALWVDSDGEEGARADLSDHDLSREDLRHVYLSGANLKGCNLSGADLSDGTIELIDLANAKLDGTNFRRATMRGANLKGVSAKECILTYADLSPIELTGPDGQKTGQIRKTDLSGADLQGAVLVRTMMQDVNLEGANLVGTILEPKKKDEITEYDEAFGSEDGEAESANFEE
jgi:uncharacterized protein YjbI with pentapeptide repeats